MKQLLLLLPLTLLSVPVQAQQVNTYGVCTQYQEVYQPGYYDNYGNYVQGGVTTQSYNVPCPNGTAYVAPAPRRCAGVPVGAILGGLGAWAVTNQVRNRWWSIPMGIVGGGALGGIYCNNYYGY